MASSLSFAFIRFLDGFGLCRSVIWFNVGEQLYSARMPCGQASMDASVQGMLKGWGLRRLWKAEPSACSVRNRQFQPFRQRKRRTRGPGTLQSESEVENSGKQICSKFMQNPEVNASSSQSQCWPVQTWLGAVSWVCTCWCYATALKYLHSHSPLPIVWPVVWDLPLVWGRRLVSLVAVNQGLQGLWLLSLDPALTFNFFV